MSVPSIIPETMEMTWVFVSRSIEIFMSSPIPGCSVFFRPETIASMHIEFWASWHCWVIVTSKRTNFIPSEVAAMITPLSPLMAVLIILPDQLGS